MKRISTSLLWRTRRLSVSDKETNYVVDLKRDENNSPFSSIADFLGSELRLESISSDPQLHSVRVLRDGTACFELQIETRFFKPPIYRILRTDGEILYDISNGVRPGVLRHGYLTDTNDSIRVTNNAVFLAESVPLEYGVAIALYIEAYS